MAHPKNWKTIAIWTGIASACFVTVGTFGCLVFEMAFPNADNAYAKDANEKAVSASEFGINGTLLINERQSIRAIDISTGKESTVFRDGFNENVFALDGPNRNGIAVVVVNNMMAKRHRLVMLDLGTGKSSNVFERAGDALWEDSIGEDVAIAEDVNVALYFVGKGSKQLYDPQAFMGTGEIRRINLDTGQEVVLTREAMNSVATGISIGATGDTAWYLTFRDRELARDLPGGDRFSESQSDAPVVVCKVGNSVDEIAAGWGARVSGDTKYMFVAGNGERESFLYQDVGIMREVPLPTYMKDAHEIIKGRYFITTAAQIRKEDVRFQDCGMNYPMPKPRIVIADSESNRVATLCKEFDPRCAWSYGKWAFPPSQDLDR
jgi:hypothetical protein